MILFGICGLFYYKSFMKRKNNFIRNNLYLNVDTSNKKIYNNLALG